LEFKKVEKMVDPVPLGKIPSGLFIVTVADNTPGKPPGEGRRGGVLGSWIQQAGFEPLLVSVALKADGHFAGFLRETGRFCVNIIGHANNGVMKPFWGKYQPGADPFTGLTVEVSPRGNLLLPDAMAALECTVREVAQPGDHLIVFGEVVETKAFKPEDKPMTHVRKSGDGY
jgi:flavin reductase (DIM6/NTAB) family NADH-FMN oxidoreductase RutF